MANTRPGDAPKPGSKPVMTAKFGGKSVQSSKGNHVQPPITGQRSGSVTYNRRSLPSKPAGGSSY